MHTSKIKVSSNSPRAGQSKYVSGYGRFSWSLQCIEATGGELGAASNASILQSPAAK